MYIAVAGNIGSGKTTLAKLIGEHLDFDILHDTEQNLYIEDFYNDMRRWSFNLQMYFLGVRLEQVSRLIEQGSNAVIDRTIYEDSEVFAQNLYNKALLSSRDYNTYKRLYQFTVTHLPKPDLLIYLKADVKTLINQIKKRGRSYELSIEPDYLKQLNDLYDSWINRYSGKLLIIDIDKEDFILDANVKYSLLERIKKNILNGRE